MDRKSQLLIVEDDREISDLVSRFLGQHGFRVTVVTDGAQMDRAFERSQFDLVILDVMLPGEDGLSLCRRLRSRSSIPIIMLTAVAEETDRIVGLEMGADDYLSKPFNPRELLARIRAVLRRGARDDSARSAKEAVLGFEGWRIDLGLRQLHDPSGVRVQLTSGEFDLLVAFCQHPRRVLSREQLLDLTHGRTAAVFDRSVDILVSRLRRKIETEPRDPNLIKTVRSGGYLFAAQVAAARAGAA